MKNMNSIIKMTIILIVGLMLGRYLLPAEHSADVEDNSNQEKEVLYWVAPMDPNYRSVEPGKSPMGMDLIPVYGGDDMSDDESLISIAPQVVQNTGVKSEPVEMGVLSRSVETVGFVAMDEDLTSHVHVRAAGWVEDLRIKTAGEEVKKGDLLFSFYSPEIANAKSELVRALASKNTILIGASRSRLRALDVPMEQVSEIVSSGKADDLVKVYAQQNGIVAALNVAEGMHIEPGTTLVSLADLSSVWVNAEVYEDQAPWLSEGAHAMVHVPFMPERMWHGIVDYVYPTVDTQTRTVRARLVFDNSDMSLKPGMYAEVAIDVTPIHHALTIPRSSLIQTGSSNRVILDMGSGTFRPVAVSVGVESGDRVQIVSGLKPGDMVVSSGQFLLDSEASLSGSFARMEGSENTTDTQVDHSQMEHDAHGNSGDGK